MTKRKNAGIRLVKEIGHFLGDRFDLKEDQAAYSETIDEIRKQVVFRGTNLWILIFAILVASVGLNVNSTAVVIGAMLISPIMGPIMGMGMGVGINDFDLIIKAAKNLAIAVVMSILASALYFSISPLQEASSELLARTQPTMWDVLIALFGGLAGIIAGSRAEKSNAIPGVAIATALMPPLCTAGYGLATAQWPFFFGAIYLFFINSVFISVATILIVRYLKFPKKEFLDLDREKRVRRYISILVIATTIPSVFTAYRVVQRTVFEQNANLFIKTELQFDNCQVISSKISGDFRNRSIDVTLFGEPVPEAFIQQAREKLPNYGIEDASLSVRQGYQGVETVDLQTLEQMNQQMRSGIIEDLYKRNEELLETKDNKIKLLEEEIIRYRSLEMPMEDLVAELKTINPNVEELSVTNSIVSHVDSLQMDTLYLAYVKFRKNPKSQEIKQLQEWLQARTKTEKIRMVTD
ncbi:MAG: TIGR00341 family protein [Saprospiraceae bacterium]|nr:TIGR00341 family protein [Saprospiraceae bacterium]